MRDELSSAALKLLAVQGFENTTIDQIVAAAGVSQRTFFRYFKSKEDVIIEFIGDLGACLRTGLAARPAAEPAGVALRHTLSVFVDAYTAFPAKSLSLVRLTLGTPALHARYLERKARWQAELAAELGRRAALDPDTDLRPALTAAVALDAFDIALAHWAAGDGKSALADLLDEAFALVAHTLTMIDPE